MRYLTALLIVACGVIASVSSAHAYIGPGMGAGVVAMILGVLGSIFLAIGAVIYYPVKRMLRKRQARKAQSEQAKK